MERPKWTWWSCNYAVTNGQTEVTIDEPQRERAKSPGLH
jgi:hypothetical protein